jgi:hypothetical protein
MPRTTAEASVDAILRDTAERVVARISTAISKRVSELVQAELAREMGGRGRGRARVARSAAPRRARKEMTRWVADTRARRVPTFVIEATGLDTKKKIVAKFGEGAAFEKGKPLPKTKAAAA